MACVKDDALLSLLVLFVSSVTFTLNKKNSLGTICEDGGAAIRLVLYKCVALVSSWFLCSSCPGVCAPRYLCSGVKCVLSQDFN